MSAMLAIADGPPRERTPFPADVSMIMSALEAGKFDDTHPGNRRMPRSHYRTVSTMHLFVDDPEAAPRIIFTRDIDRRGVGFITQSRLPLGYGGRASVPLPDGLTVSIQCVVLRCREVSPGWYEGGLLFNREQTAFDELLPDAMTNLPGDELVLRTTAIWQAGDEM